MNAFCYGVRRQSAATTALLLGERMEVLGRRSHSAVVAALCRRTPHGGAINFHPFSLE